MKEELIRLWCKYISRVVRENPNYTDNEFTFVKFMNWLQDEYDEFDESPYK